MEALAAVGFQSVPEATKQQLKDCFSTMSTTMVEHAFKSLRKVETRDQDSCTVSAPRKWWAPIDQEVMTERYAYQQVPWKAQEVHSSESRTLPPGLFKAPTAPGRTSFPFSGIVSESK
eukprot:2485532-Lingulodinium_polyedra.AAC.1